MINTINTIFYFASGQSEYDSNAQALQINERTISFVPKTDDRGNIYKNNIRYGGVDADLDYTIIKGMIERSMNQDKIVKVETLLNDGTPIARITVGSDVKTLYAPAGNGSSGSGEGGGEDTPGEGGTTVVENPYDDQWIRDAIAEMEARAANEKQRVKEYINDKDIEIRDLVDHMFEDYDDIIDRYIHGKPLSVFTFGTDADTWVSQMAGVTKNDDGTYNVNWSEIFQSISELRGEVNQIKASQGTGAGEVDYNLLSSNIYALIENDYATNGLNSMWAKMVGQTNEFDEETRTILEWMASDVKTWAGGYWYDTKDPYVAGQMDADKYKPEQFHEGDFTKDTIQLESGEFGDWAAVTDNGSTTAYKYSNMTYTDMMSAAREYAEDGKTILQEAAAGVHALVEKQDDGTYKASATLSSLVDDAYAGVVAESIKDEAIAQVSAQVNAEIDGKIETATSGLTTRVSNIEDAGYIKGQEAESIIATKVANATSSFATKTYVDDAVESTEAAMASRIGDVESTISTDVVKKDGGYISNAKIYADDVTITSTRKLNVTSADGIDISTSTINSLLDNCTIHFKNLDLGTDKIPFDNLNITGTNINTFASSININNLDGQDTFINALNSNLAVKKLIAGGVTADSNGVVVKNSSGNIAGQLLSTGAGSIANGQITWDADGNVTGIGTLLETKLGDELVVKKLTATNGSSSVVVDNTGITVRPSSSATSAIFNSDGSGSIANGAITWTTSGTLSFGSGMKSAIISAADGSVSATSLSAGNGVVTANSNGISVVNGTKKAAVLNADGSGSIANEAISWSSDGTISGISTNFKTKLEDELVLKKLTVTNGSSVISINPTDGIKQTISGTTKNQIALDGSGSFANGNISWNTSGTTTIKGTFTTGDSGYQWKMKPGSTYASIDLSNGTSTPVSISGNNSNGGWLKLYNPSDDSYVYLYGTNLRFATDDNSVDDGISIGYSKSIDQTNVHFGRKSGPNSSWWGTDSYMWVTTQYNDDIAVRTVVNSSEATVVVNDSSGINRISSTGQIASSDIRLKDVIANKELAAEQIADAPIFTYTPKANPNANPILGTSAQYWQNILPEAVSEINGYLALDYTKVATTSVINLAKEVVTLKSENTSLRERVEALEARLQLIENKFNAQ